MLVIVHCVFDKLEDLDKFILHSSLSPANAGPLNRGLDFLNEVAFTTQASGDVEERCLDGTRTEIIDAIVSWAVHAESPDAKERIGRMQPRSSAQVLWLCGVAGSGKSRISRSVAAVLQKLQRLGSFYCCDYTYRASLNPGNLFSTIAQHLADHDPPRKQHLDMILLPQLRMTRLSAPPRSADRSTRYHCCTFDWAYCWRYCTILNVSQMH